jgi:hypothetical protein
LARVRQNWSASAIAACVSGSIVCRICMWTMANRRSAALALIGAHHKRRIGGRIDQLPALHRMGDSEAG